MRNLVWFEKTDDGIISGRRDVVLHVQLQAGQQLMSQSKKLQVVFAEFFTRFGCFIPKSGFSPKTWYFAQPIHSWKFC